MDFKATNPYASMQVNLQAADFQRQQQAQETADILGTLSGGAGGAGAAALATSLARSSLAKQQQLAGQITGEGVPGLIIVSTSQSAVESTTTPNHRWWRNRPAANSTGKQRVQFPRRCQKSFHRQAHHSFGGACQVGNRAAI